MKRVFIVHGWGGNPSSGWVPWLRNALEARGYQVNAPIMPNADAPVIKDWVKHLTDIVGTPDKETYFVGHSIGCQTILRYLETVDKPVGGAVFVAGWFNLENLESDKVKQIAKPWIEIPINMEKVKSVLPKSTLIISETDPFECFEENRQKFGKTISFVTILPN